MITPRRSADRGRGSYGWLDARYSFSFAGYHDPAHMGFGALRVLNEDRIAGGGGFPTHPHRDMEILTYVIEGSLEHRDSLGNGSVVRAGELQRMTAGTGVFHSEANGSADEDLHLLQVWIAPSKRGLTPGYEQRRIDGRDGGLRLVASPDGRDGALTVHQDAEVYSAVLAAGDEVEHLLAPGRRAWLQVVRGRLRLGDELLRGGDGTGVTDEASVTLAAEEEAELLLFDLA